MAKLVFGMQNSAKRAEDAKLVSQRTVEHSVSHSNERGTTDLFFCFAPRFYHRQIDHILSSTMSPRKQIRDRSVSPTFVFRAEVSYLIQSFRIEIREVFEFVSFALAPCLFFLKRMQLATGAGTLRWDE